MEAAALAPSPPPPPLFPLPPFPPLPFPFPPFAWAPDCSAVAGCADCCTTHNRNFLEEITNCKQALETHGKDDLDAMQKKLLCRCRMSSIWTVGWQSTPALPSLRLQPWPGLAVYSLCLPVNGSPACTMSGRHQRVCAKTGSAQPIATVQACPPRKMDKSSDAIVQLVNLYRPNGIKKSSVD